MTEDSPPDAPPGPDAAGGTYAQDHRPARARFRLELHEPTRRASFLRNLALLAIGALNLGAGPTNPGGRRARVTDLDTGAELAVLPERFGDEAGGVIAEAEADLDRLDVATFADRWLDAPVAADRTAP